MGDRCRRHPDARSFVVAQLTDEQSPLCVTGPRMLDAEFRDAEQTRTVLEAIDVPVGTHARGTKTRRYRIVDPYLRFWFRYCHPHLADIAAATGRSTVAWLGTIKWRPTKPISAGEIAALAEARAIVPAAATAWLLAVCPAGAVRNANADATLAAVDILAAWRPR